MYTPKLFSNKIKKSQLQPADHIYSYRDVHTYSHHGIYMGEKMDRVIHFTRTEEKTWKLNSKFNGASDYCCEKCGFEPNKQRGVVETCLDCFLKDHSLYRCEYGVSKVHRKLKRPGTCHVPLCDPPEKVIERAVDMLRNNGFGDYSLSRNNCESFAVYCKTGNRDSAQADSYMLPMARDVLNKFK